jgi:hypothetical protein
LRFLSLNGDRLRSYITQVQKKRKAKIKRGEIQGRQIWYQAGFCGDYNLEGITLEQVAGNNSSAQRIFLPYRNLVAQVLIEEGKPMLITQNLEPQQ